ncbi:MAG: kipA [Ilumatobacteraceae bacterium]|nr:kipA [Ilumatobacteraceae bacterium]
MLEILAPGPLCTVQDLGRPGWAHLGVGASGAADREAHRLANRLVGNPDDAATLECTFGGLRVRFETAVYVAIAGAECPATTEPFHAVGHRQPVALAAGTELVLGMPRSGLRTYLAVRGGIDAPAVMGSRSTDLLSGLGLPPLVFGDRLGIGASPSTNIPTALAPAPPPDASPVALWPGPRHHWFTASAHAALVAVGYEVLSTSNRIGARLHGATLERSVLDELPSEAIVDGAVQVPNDGQPLVFLADHGVTGGYPVIAIVDPGDLGRVAQARPGEQLHFRWCR